MSLCQRFARSPGPVSLDVVDLILFGASAVAIYLACEYFVNAVEWAGQRLSLGATATGTVLAAFGTALPESAVTFVAVVFGKTQAARDIGVGAAMGGPLALAIFVCKVALGLVAFALKPWLGVLFLLAYTLYVWREIRSDYSAPEDETLEPLKFRPADAEPALRWVLAQTVAALAVIALASRVFVSQLEAIGLVLGLPPHLVALVLSPVATELPETINALIWVRQGRENLALANISGAMMIQATVPARWPFSPRLGCSIRH